MISSKSLDYTRFLPFFGALVRGHCLTVKSPTHNCGSGVKTIMDKSSIFLKNRYPISINRFVQQRRTFCGASVCLHKVLVQRQFGFEEKSHGLKYKKLFRRNIGTSEKKNRLPDLLELSSSPRRLPILFAAFCLLWGTCAVLAIQYGKQNSNVTQVVMYRVQHSKEAQDLLGSNIDFKYPFPWVPGKLHKRQGFIDINFEVSGSLASGTVHYQSQRFGPIAHWVELDCTLTSNGKTIKIPTGVSKDTQWT